ncbi:MAG: PAS domain S-box protein [Desulfuromonadaceae bacterium]
MNALIIAHSKQSGIFTKTCRYLLTSLLLIIIISTAAHCGGDNLLTPEEQRWLNENKSRIILAVETGYPPFAFLDSKGKPSGLAHDYLLQLELKLGVNFSQKQFSSLDEIFSKVRSGEVQIVNAVTKTPARSEFLLFTEPFISVPNVIVVRKEHPGNMLEKDLSGLKVSLVKSYAITEHLSKTGTGIVTDIVPNDLTAILNVSFGQSDAAVIDIATASYLISQKGITNLRVAGEVSLGINLSMAVPNSEAMLNNILQKGLKSITEAERHKIQDKWIHSTNKGIFSDWRFWAVVGGAFCVICLLIIGSFMWNKILRRQVVLQTSELAKEQEALRDSEAYNRMLFNQSPIGLALTQMDGKLVDVNQAYADIIGRTIDEALTLNYWDITPEKYALQEQEQLTALNTVGEYGPYEKEYIHKDGHLVPVRLQGLLIERKGEKYIWSSVEDITERKTIESVQSFISERGWLSTKEEFFPALARFLSETLALEFICIDRLTGDGLMACTVAVYHNGSFEDNVEYALKDTPCGDVVGKTICCFPRDVASLFPNDPVLKDIKAESYAGITLWGNNEEPIGLIAVIGEKPFANQQLVETVLQYVAPRAAGELEREMASETLAEQADFSMRVFNSTDSHMAVVDRNGVILGVNNAWRNFAIDNLHLTLRPGLTVLTGETGAGKSIIIDAVGLIMGGRASVDLIRSGVEDASVEAIFDISGLPEVQKSLEEAGLAAGNELLIKRSISRSGKNRIFINGSMATLTILIDITSRLINIYGQHESQTLLRTDNQLALLDSFAGTTTLRDQFAEIFRAHTSVVELLENLETQERETARRLDLLSFQSEEIAAAGLKAGEEEELEELRQILASAGKLGGVSSEAFELLYGGDGAILG